MLLILLMLFLSSSAQFPKYSYLYVNRHFTDEIEKELKKQWESNKKIFKKGCKDLFNEEDIEKCTVVIEGMQDLVLSNGQNLDLKLPTISTNTEFLFFINYYNEDHTINFNSLNTKMTVFCFHDTPIYLTSVDPNQLVYKIVKKFTKKMIKSSFDGSQEGIIRLSEQFKPKNNEITESATYIKYNGNINDKVSFLTIANANISFIGNINCESLYLKNCSISDYSDEIRTNYFIVDPYTHSNIRGYSSKESLINVKEYAITQVDKSNNNKYQIQYGRREWYVNLSIISTFAVLYSAKTNDRRLY